MMTQSLWRLQVRHDSDALLWEAELVDPSHYVFAEVRGALTSERAVELVLELALARVRAHGLTRGESVR